MRIDRLKIIGFLEGLSVPIRSVVMSTGVGRLTTAMISIVPTIAVSGLVKGTIVQIFIKVGDGEPHLFFDGMLMSKRYTQTNGSTEASINAVAFNEVLNNIPSPRMVALSARTGDAIFPTIKSYMEGAFKGFTSKEISREALRISGESVYNKKKGLYGYLKDFFTAVSENDPAGGEALLRYAMNLSRMSIAKNHVVVGSKIYDELKSSQFMTAFLTNAKTKMMRAPSIIELSKELLNIGLQYINIPNPIKITNLPQAGTAFLENEPLLTTGVMGGTVLPQYVITPKFVNFPPPQCNVINLTSAMTLTANINPPAITRIMNYGEMEIGEPQFETYPNAKIKYEKGRMNNTEMSERERLLGISALIDGTGIDLYRMAKATAKKGKEKDVLKRLAIFKYYNLAYRNNTAEVSIPFYDPRYVVGLPAVITSDSNDQPKLYGEIKQLTLVVNQDTGGTSTRLTIGNVREIRDFHAISFDDKGKNLTSPFINAERSKVSEVYKKILGVDMTDKDFLAKGRPIVNKEEYDILFGEKRGKIKDLIEKGSKINEKISFVIERRDKVKEYRESLNKLNFGEI